jgi:hypothetical protein
MVRRTKQPAEQTDAGTNGTTPPSFPVPGTPEWGRMNQRRAELIDKQVDSSLTAAEQAELKELQRQTREAIDKTHPLPPPDLAALRRLEEELQGQDGSAAP